MGTTSCCRYIDSRAENGLTALHIAAVRGDLKLVKLLLEAGASMMVRTVDMDMPSPHSVPNGSTPLHLAAQKGSVGIVQAMLQVSPLLTIGPYASCLRGRPYTLRYSIKSLPDQGCNSKTPRVFHLQHTRSLHGQATHLHCLSTKDCPLLISSCF